MSLKRILPLYVVIFFGFLGYAMMITLFTPMFMYGESGIISSAASLGYRIIILGVVLALFPFAQFFGSPILGSFSDRFGRRPVLLISLYLAPICYAVIAWALMIPSLTLLMIGSLVAGATQGNIVIAQSSIADIADPKERGSLFGYIYLSASLAYVVGPLMGGKLIDPTIVPWFGYATPFWMVFGLLVITLFWTQIVFRETQLKKETHINCRQAFTNLLTIFTSSKLRIIYLVNFLLYFSIFGFFRCYPMFIVNRFHISPSKLSEFIAWVAVPIILVNLGLTGSLSRRFLPRTLAIWAGLLTGIFMILIVIPASQNSLWITLFLTSTALALLLPSCATMLSLASRPTEQGRTLGNNQSLQVAAEALSAFIGGLIATITVELSLIVLGGLACFTAWLIFLVRRQIPEYFK